MSYGDLVPLEYPQLFRGLFADVRVRYEPLLEEGRAELRGLPIPRQLSPFYDYVVRDNPQPAFVLMPLMFLAMADAAGGIGPRHRQFLPTLMLMMEAVAVADDTVDRTPMRSGRASFPGRFDDCSSAPFVGALTALVCERARQCDERAFDLSRRFLVELFALELWEHQNVYPSHEGFEEWLRHRYRQAAIAVEIALDAALALSGHALLSREVSRAFASLCQDVDDIVNLVEYREGHGENDDLKMGIITRPLVFAVKARPALAREVASMWELYRAARRELHSTEHSSRAQALYLTIRAEIIETGVPPAVREVLRDLRTCTEETPRELRRVMREMAAAFVDRLRRCELVDPGDVDG
jgi:geranylgeranyl pyrophosphate synthase